MSRSKDIAIQSF